MHFSGQSERKMKAQPGRFSHASRFAADLVRLLFAACVLCVTAANIRGQLPEPPLPVDPRPLAELLSPAERAFVAEANNPKKLVEVYLKISDTHLQVAFNGIKVNNTGVAERELDIYNKAVAAAGKEAFALQDGKRTVSKKIEQTLYRQIKTLETIERLFPSERELFADAALKHAKQLRVQALNEAFASGDVLKDPEEEKKPKSEQPTKEAPIKNPTSLPLGGGAFRRNVSLPRAALLNRRMLVPVNASYVKTASAFFQIPGDYLTEEEDDHVREAQAADERAKVFMKIAERRLKRKSKRKNASGEQCRR
jgi:hypothetical protein